MLKQPMPIRDLVNEYGAKNLRFFIPMRCLQMIGFIPGIAFKNDNSPEVSTECEINEDRYVVDDNYKITLQALNPMYGKEHYYQMDLDTILEKSPEFTVYVLNSDGYTQL